MSLRGGDVDDPLRDYSALTGVLKEMLSSELCFTNVLVRCLDLVTDLYYCGRGPLAFCNLCFLFVCFVF